MRNSGLAHNLEMKTQEVGRNDLPDRTVVLGNKTNTMNSFFSGTDDANENNTQFYGVWGKVDKEEPAFSFRYVVGDTKEEVEPTMLIDWPTIHRNKKTIVTETFTFKGDTELIDLEIRENEYTTGTPAVEEEHEELVKGPFKQIEYPDDWMGQHSTRTVRYSGTTYGSGKTSGTYSSNYYGSGWDDYYGSGHNYSGYYEQESLFPEDNEAHTSLPIDMYYLNYISEHEVAGTINYGDDFEPSLYFRHYVQDMILALMEEPEGLRDFY